MTNAKSATKKLLSVVLCLAMVLPMLFATGITPWLSIFDSVVPEAQAASSIAVIGVPETIYMTPSQGASVSAQYYVNNNVSNSGVLTPEALRNDTNGTIGVYAPGSTAIKFNVTAVTGGIGDPVVGGSAANANSSYENQKWEHSAIKSTYGTGADQDWFVFDGFQLFINGTGLSAGNVALIKWDFTIYYGASDTTGINYTAYSTLYSPWYQPVGAASRAVGSHHNVYTSSIVWVSGVHGYSDGDRANSWYVQTANFLPIFGTIKAPGNNNPDTNWIQSGSNGLSPTMAYNSISESGVNYHGRANTISPNANLTVDTSRYTNFNQIPNFTVGFMVTDRENAQHERKWYVSDYHTKGSSYYNGTDRGSSQYTSDWNDTGTIFSQSGDDDSSTGVKYNSTWNKAITGSGTYRIKGAASGKVNKTITSTSWNNSFVNISVTGVDKSQLRELVVSSTVYRKENYTSASWSTFQTALENAALSLGNPTASDAATQYTNLNNALNNLQTTITLDAGTNGGRITEGSTTITYTVGKDVSGTFNVNPDAIATKDGWNWIGWSADIDAKIASKTSVPAGFNSTLYAIYSKQYSTRFYYLNNQGGNTSNSPSTTVYNNDTYSFTVPAGVATVKSNGTFSILGFRTDTTPAAATIAIGASIPAEEAAVAYYAVYSRDDLKLSFDANGGSGAPAAQTAKQYLNAGTATGGIRTKVSFTIPTDAPTATGYEFAGWATSKISAAAYQPGETIEIDMDTVLYATWKAEGYDITFDENGGDAIADMTYTTDSTSILPNASRTGYRFVGWEAKETVGTWVAGQTYNYGTPLKGHRGNIEFLAKWEALAVGYTVYHMTQTVDGTGYEQYFIDNNTSALADSEIVVNDLIKTDITGFELTKIALSADGEAYAGEKVAVNADGSTAVYIYYDRLSYSVAVNAGNGITAVTGAGTYLYGTEVTVTASVVEGFAFTAWTGDLSSDQAEFTFTLTGDVTLTANADVVSYTVSVNGNGATVPADSALITYTFSDVITLPELTRAGYDFAGWTVEADGSSVNNWAATLAENTVSAGKYGNVIVIAQWTAKTYTITFDENGANEIADITYTINDTTTLPVAVKHGYMFKEWQVTAADGNWVADSKYAQGFSVNGKYGNVTLQAQFTEIPYTLSFDADGGSVTPGFITYNIANENNAVLPMPVRPGYTFNGWECLTAKADDKDPNNACDWVVGTVYKAGADLTGIAGNATFKALWTANFYSVTATVTNGTFAGATGADVVTAGVDYSATVAANLGYKLNTVISVKVDGKELTLGNDFTYQNGEILIKGAAIVGDVVITVGTTAIEYAIIYKDINAGHSFPTKYSIEDGDVTIGEPSRNGYRFDGWSGTGLDELTKVITIPAGSSGDREYTANWTKSYRIEFNTSGGDAIRRIDYVAGESVVIPAAVKSGYKFLYWTVSGAWTDSTILPGTYTDKSGDVTLTAVFAASTSYTVQEYFMDTDGNYGSPQSTVYSENVFAGDSASVTPSEYEGFTLASQGNVLSGTILENGALILKVYYTRNQYNVTVNADANTDVTGAGRYYYGETVALKATAKLGYTFNGWTGAATSNESEIAVVIGTSDIALNATSTVNKYTVTFVREDGEAAPAAITYTINDTVALPDLAKVGYDMYWFLETADGNWESGNVAAGDYSAKYGNITLTAKWVAATNTPYTVEEYFQNIENAEYAEADVKNMTGTTDTVVAEPSVYEGFATPVASELTINGDGTTVVKYYYTRNSYTVTYKVNESIDVLTYKYGQTVPAYADPAIGGYKFNGWDKEFVTVMPAENLTYTAKLSLISYTITFKGVLGSSIAPITYNVTQQVTLPKTTAAGYTVEWNLADDSGNWTAGVYTPGTYEAGKYGNFELTANNIANTNTPYTEKVILQNTDGTYADAVASEKYGTTDSVVAAPAEIEGFTAPKASTVKIKGDGTTVVTYTYNRNIYSVTYDVMGKQTVEKYYFDAEINKPADPAIDGYNFTRWDYEIANKMPASNLTYIAEFEVINYTITFDADGGSEVDTVTYTIEDDVTVAKSSKYGFHLEGWQIVAADGSWTVGEMLPENFSGKFGNVEVKAVWSEKKADYTVEIYYMNTNGTYDAAAETITCNGLVGADATYEMPAVVGFTSDSASVLSAVIKEDGSTVLKAYYSRNKYTVTTAVEGNGTITATADYYYGATVEITVTPEEHYVVSSWTGVEATGSVASFVMPAEAVEIKAVVVPVVYTYSFDGAVTEYTIEDAITVPDATKGGYEFNGWTIKTAAGNWNADQLAVGAELTNMYGNVVIESSWTAKVYTFTYDVDGGEMPESYYTPAGEYTAKDPIVLPAPTKTGFRFAGWVVVKADEADCNWEDRISSKEDNIGNGRYGNVTLVAQWTALDVEVYVEHYLQYTWSDDYMLLDKYTDYQSAGAEINIEEEVAKKHEGAYHFVKALVGDEEATTVTVNADGTTSIKLYYDLDVHTVTVNYKTPDGVEAPAQYVGEFRYGQNFNVKSPTVVGYKPSSVNYAGRMDTTDLEVTITYEAAVYEVTVNYLYEGNKTAKPSVTEKVGYGAEYSITSPVIAGYTPSLEVVEGTMADGNVTIDVIYAINTSTLTIKYLFTDGTEAAPAYVANLAYNYAYNVKSAEVEGYVASSPYVSGKMPAEDTVIIVTYAPKTFTVLFVDYDGTIISEVNVEYGKAATAPAAPTRANDDKYSYEFKAWSADYSNVTSDMTVTAQYISTNLSTGETSGDEEVDDSFFGKIKAFFQRIIKFFKVLFMIT